MKKPRGTLAERYRSKIKADEITGCWEWQATRNNKGYGMLRVSAPVGKRLAHRISYELHIGPIPDGQKVLHHCDNPGCSNPDHLFLGSMKDNYADMVAKGRRVLRALSGDAHPSRANPIWITKIKRGDSHPARTGSQRIYTGEAHWKAKLTENQVRECREQYAAGASLSTLVKTYGIGKRGIQGILRGKFWKHVGGPITEANHAKHETYIGSVHANSKLTEEIVKLARQRHAQGVSGQKLADEYGVSLSVMYDALKGRSWKHVT